MVKNQENISVVAKKFKTIINPILLRMPLSEKEAEKIASFFEIQTVEKNEIFSHKGQPCKKLGVLVSGLLCASYDTPKKTNEISRFMFLPDDFIVADFESFTREIPARETITAIEKSELLVISYENVLKLYKAVPKMNYIGREIAEHAYIKAMHRIYDLQVLKAEDRVEKFFKSHPSFYNRVGKQEIASYLRMNRNLITKYFKPDKNIK